MPVSAASGIGASPSLLYYKNNIPYAYDVEPVLTCLKTCSNCLWNCPMWSITSPALKEKDPGQYYGLGNRAEQGRRPAERGNQYHACGYAGSSWYFLRYMDPGQRCNLCRQKCYRLLATGRLALAVVEQLPWPCCLYSRMWTKALRTTWATWVLRNLSGDW